jgi:hypothetical protein
MTSGGNLYFWSKSSGEGVLYWARRTVSDSWSDPEQQPQSLQTDSDETQPWVNDSETVIYFNRRGEDGNTQLMVSTRPDASSQWNAPQSVFLQGFADANGYLIWGEPSFTSDGRMFFVRFNTGTSDWDAELLFADKNEDGSYGPPQKLIFKFDSLAGDRK